MIAVKFLLTMYLIYVKITKIIYQGDMMNVLILNGSPKCEKSDTLCMSNAFARGIVSVSGGDTVTVHTAEKHIEYCTGCFICKKTGKCIIDDDMQEILDKISKSDVVIFSFPVYCHSMPAALKVAVERTMPLSFEKIVKSEGGNYHHIEREDAKKKRFVMICGSGYPQSRDDFELIRKTFLRTFRQCDAVITVEESPLFNIKDAAPAAKPRLQLLEKAGAEYAEYGAVSEQTMEALSVPMIPEEIYMRFANGEK